MSTIWDYFNRETSTAVCNVCQKTLSLGHSEKKKQTAKNIKNHLQKMHPEEWKIFAANVIENGDKKECKTNLPIKRKLNDDVPQKADNHLENLKRRRDDADVFGEGWAVTFRKLDTHQQIYAKRIIDEVLTQGQLGHLTYSSSLNIEEPQLTDVIHATMDSYDSTPNLKIRRRSISSHDYQPQTLSPTQFPLNEA